MKYLAILCVLAPLCASQYQDLHFRVRRQNHEDQGPPINYRPFNQVPQDIQQLLHAQLARDPVYSIPISGQPLAQHPGPAPQYQPQPQHQAPQAAPQYAPQQPLQSQHQVQPSPPISQYRPKVQIGSAPAQPTYKSIQVAPVPHNLPLKVAFNPSQFAPEPHQPLQGFRRIPHPQLDPLPNYSKNVPAHLQQLIKSQYQ